MLSMDKGILSYLIDLARLSVLGWNGSTLEAAKLT